LRIKRWKRCRARYLVLRTSLQNIQGGDAQITVVQKRQINDPVESLLGDESPAKQLRRRGIVSSTRRVREKGGYRRGRPVIFGNHRTGNYHWDCDEQHQRTMRPIHQFDVTLQRTQTHTNSQATVGPKTDALAYHVFAPAIGCAGASRTGGVCALFVGLISERAPK
jgi:hypothetical protein